jgi:hypothetical protein
VVADALRHVAGRAWMQDRRRATARLIAGLAVAAGTALLSAGCSSTATPGLYPTVLNDPPAHEDTPLKPDEVKQAVDNLISDRNHLCSETTAHSSNDTPHCGDATGSVQTAGAAAKP